MTHQIQPALTRHDLMRHLKIGAKIRILPSHYIGSKDTRWYEQGAAYKVCEIQHDEETLIVDIGNKRSDDTKSMRWERVRYCDVASFASYAADSKREAC